MSLRNTTAPKDQVFKREMLCWRDRELDEHYECTIKSGGEGAVRIEFDSYGLNFSAEVAYELAFSLSEAIAFNDQTDPETTTAAVREDDTVLQRKFRLISDWHLSATGEVPYTDASPELTDAPSGNILVTIRTLKPGGFEMELEWMGYSFSKDDAAWLKEKLLEASGQQLEVYPRECLFEVVGRQGHKIRG
ncbi:hypothetical protein HU764_012255 [Pseudomonas sp. SWRI100]|uniref:hypothetical protein n=1 Tax=Pseudomonas TaxID=286 RepID=UPI0016461AC5|nr:MULTISPECIES: hypothetical protein [Pseudomonas]MBC3495762.1 hypothetical protein [Pseudomonas sp. SWRI67]MBV4526871.1 hypothetical protein [Pseudomonas kermanshahensis]